MFKFGVVCLNELKIKEDKKDKNEITQNVIAA